MIRRYLFLFIVGMLFHGANSYGFALPENLVFELTWAGIKAGTATLEIERTDQGALRITSTARSADWVSVFYTVDDRIETMLANSLSSEVGLPVNYHVKIREGRHRRDKEIVFDHGKRTAFFVDHLQGEKKTISIQDNVFDPLASFYYVRTMPLEVGRSVFIDILDSKKLWNVEVQVLRREKIRTKLGNFDTVVIKPLMKSEGIFNRKGDMQIWLTNDRKRIPVKMQTKVAVGNVTATLVEGYY